MWPKVSLPPNALFGVGVVMLVGLIVYLSKKLYENQSTPVAVVRRGASLVRQAAEDGLTAQQLKNPLLALTKVNDARTRLKVARELVRDDELQKATSMAVSDLADDLDQEERRARDRVLKLSPVLAVNYSKTTPRSSTTMPSSTSTTVPASSQTRGDQYFTPL
jgi:hypothetical protein